MCSILIPSHFLGIHWVSSFISTGLNLQDIGMKETVFCVMKLTTEWKKQMCSRQENRTWSLQYSSMHCSDIDPCTLGVQESTCLNLCWRFSECIWHTPFSSFISAQFRNRKFSAIFLKVLSFPFLDFQSYIWVVGIKNYWMMTCWK